METHVLIYNPNASKGKTTKTFEKVLSLFKQSNLNIKILKTKKKNDAKLFAEQATYEGYKNIIAVGGDGTVNEVLNGIMSASESWELNDRPSLGIIPLGRGNDFCYTAKVPTDINKAVEAIINNKKEKIDIGVAISEDTVKKFFINGVGIGVEAAITFKASTYKKITGALSYICAAISTLIRYPKPMKVKLILDDKVETYESQQISIGNGKRMGNMFLMCPNAEINDGYLDLVWANQKIPRSKIIPFAVKFLKGKQLESDKFFSTKFKEIFIESEQKDMTIHCDGEEISLKSNSLYSKILENGIYLLKK